MVGGQMMAASLFTGSKRMEKGEQLCYYTP